MFICVHVYRCQCGSCEVMPTSAESRCCREIDQVWRKVEDQRPEHDFSCITAHPGFHSTCLDVWVLETAFHAYVQQHGGGNHTGHEYVSRAYSLYEFVLFAEKPIKTSSLFISSSFQTVSLHCLPTTGEMVLGLPWQAR